MQPNGSIPQRSIGELVAEVYPELRRMATIAATRTPVSPSSLVQDSVCRILKLPKPPDSADAVRAAAFNIMRWIVIDRFRSDHARDARERRSITDRLESDSELPEIAAALAELAELCPRKAEALMLHVVSEMPASRIASVLDVNERTVHRDLDFARRWIAARLASRESHSQ